MLQLSPTPLPSTVAPIKSRMEIFWYWLTQVHLEKWAAKMWREHMALNIVTVHADRADSNRSQKHSSS